MKLYIDGTAVTARPGQSLYDIASELGLITGKLSSDPIVAKITGRVFTLNYIPVREKDVLPERSTVRKAMAASGGVIRLLRYDDPAAREAYMRTVQFVIFLAVKRLWPEATAKRSCTLGPGMYVKVTGDDSFSYEKLKAEIQSIINENIYEEISSDESFSVADNYSVLITDNTGNLTTYTVSGNTLFNTKTKEYHHITVQQKDALDLFRKE